MRLKSLDCSRFGWLHNAESIVYVPIGIAVAVGCVMRNDRLNEEIGPCTRLQFPENWHTARR